ncbi:MAG: hypothetical protein H7Y22_04230 [Gemmatimonadaceae bacterium]|nr:hypothetical protein [Gloeobacterales cyanobacterium ES-bin-141]
MLIVKAPYEQFGLESLWTRGRRPETLPYFKLTAQVLGWIRELHEQRLGSHRIGCS